MSLRLTALLAALAAFAAVPTMAGADGVTYPIKGYTNCTADIQQRCAQTTTPKVDRPAMQACLDASFNQLKALCQMDVRDHIYLDTDCQGQGGEIIDKADCTATGKACHFLSVQHAPRCITRMVGGH